MFNNSLVHLDAWWKVGQCHPNEEVEGCVVFGQDMHVCWAAQGATDKVQLALTNKTELQVDETLELLMEAGGPSFRRHTQAWSAAHVGPHR